MTHPEQSDFLANRIRYVQNQPHLQQPPAPETSLGSDPSWFIRFPLVHQAPESPGRPGLPGHPSSPGPAATCLPTWRGRRFTRPTVSPGSEDQYSLHPRVYTADQTWTSPGTGPGPRPGPGLHLDLDYTWTWTWTWTSPGHQRFLQIRRLLRFLLQLHRLHLGLLLLSLPRPVIKLVQLQVSWPSEREQRGPILTQPRHLEPRDSPKFQVPPENSSQIHPLRADPQ